MRYCKLQLSSSCGGPVVGMFNGTHVQRGPSEFCSPCLVEAVLVGLEPRLFRMDFDELLRRLDEQITSDIVEDPAMYRRTLYAALLEHGWNKAEYLEALSQRIAELETLNGAAV